MSCPKCLLSVPVPRAYLLVHLLQVVYSVGGRSPYSCFMIVSSKRAEVKMKASWFLLIMCTLGVGESRRPDIQSPSVQRPPYSASCYENVTIEPRFFTHLDTQRLNINYGPFTVPPKTQNGGLKNFYLQTSPPCRDCLLTHIEASLVDPNGSPINIKTDLILHHLLVTNLERDSVTCPLLAEPIYSTGNELAEANISLNESVPAPHWPSHSSRLLLPPDPFSFA
ncbi:hypothetical protein VTI74DRAFT_5486 [Chaetomium olivicolor]